MKIEKLSENQIRCILSGNDLEDRQLSLKEISYGSAKARNLFHEMLQAASREVGFEAEDIPLMIEAIPLMGDSLMVIITKVENPDELDGRFSRFTADEEDIDSLSSSAKNTLLSLAGGEEVLEALSNLLNNAGKQEEEKEVSPEISPAMYRFSDIDNLLRLCPLGLELCQSRSSLYYSAAETAFYLVIAPDPSNPSDFNRICNVLTEYGLKTPGSKASEAYCKEHYRTVFPQRAFRQLSKLA